MFDVAEATVNKTRIFFAGFQFHHSQIPCCESGELVAPAKKYNSYLFLVSGLAQPGESIVPAMYPCTTTDPNVYMKVIIQSSLACLWLQ